MSNIKEQVKQEIKHIIKKAFDQIEEFQGIDPGEIFVEVPKEKNHGEFSSNIAMVIVKKAKMAPIKIAQKIVDHMDVSQTYVERIECAPPGFINFYLKNDWLYEGLKNVLKDPHGYGESNLGDGKNVMIEYVSANPTGPLHMGNARGGALGDLIANVLQKVGYKVTKEFYINDAGNQIEKFGLSLEGRYLQAKLGEDHVTLPEDAYQGEDIKELVDQYIAQEDKELTQVPSDERQRILIDYALPKNIEKIKDTLARYGIEYDEWFSEKTLHESGLVDQTIDYLKDKGHTMEKDGALWLKGEAIGTEKDEVIVRANGIPTYYAADIAYHWNKYHIRKFDRVINLLGADHHGHVERMKGAVECIGVDRDRIDIVIFQLVRLLRSGEMVRMSKRTGKAITLEDLLDETGVDAARFFFNMKSSGSHLDFDLDLAVKQSNENPVFYVQYAHARICSLLKILKEEGYHVDDLDGNEDFTLMNTSFETELIKKLCEYPDELIISAQTLEPSRLTRYAIELAGLFHSFYNACRLKGEEDSLLYARLSLVKGVQIVLSNVLDVMRISAPEKM